MGMYAQIQFLLHLRPRPALLPIVVYDLRSQQYEFITKGGAYSLNVAARSIEWLVRKRGGMYLSTVNST